MHPSTIPSQQLARYLVLRINRFWLNSKKKRKENLNSYCYFISWFLLNPSCLLSDKYHDCFWLFCFCKQHVVVVGTFLVWTMACLGSRVRLLIIAPQPTSPPYHPPYTSSICKTEILLYFNNDNSFCSHLRKDLKSSQNLGDSRRYCTKMYLWAYFELGVWVGAGANLKKIVGGVRSLNLTTKNENTIIYHRSLKLYEQ